MKEIIQCFASDLRVVDAIWIVGGLSYAGKKLYRWFMRAHGYLSKQEDKDKLLEDLAVSIKELSEKIEAGNEAHREVLKDRLEQMHSYYMKRGYITPSELDKASSMYVSYHRLNGNGVGTRMYEDMMALDIREHKKGALE